MQEMDNLTYDSIDKIVNSHFWKSKKDDLRALVLYERKFNEYSFCNPLHIIRNNIKNMYLTDDTSKRLEVKICKWHPNNSLNFIYTVILRIIYIKQQHCFRLTMHDFFNNNFETCYNINQNDIFELFETIYMIYIKKIVYIEYNNQINYLSSINTFSFMNDHIRRISILRIENAWISYKIRLKHKHKSKYKWCLLEILLLPQHGYCGTKKHIKGGILYWKCRDDFLCKSK
jgi:hypothetical protein